MAFEIDGITLPDLPIPEIPELKYNIVIASDTNGVTGYTLYSFSVPAVVHYLGAGNYKLYNDEGFYAEVPYDTENACWGSETINEDAVVQSGFCFITGKVDDVIYWVHGADHNIMYDSKDEVWIAKNMDSLRYAYTVKTKDLKNLSDQTRRLSGVSDKLEIEQMAEVLEGCNFALQEKTVTPTDTAQEVTPDSGFYGLSKVTVEAVESSGGGMSFSGNASGVIPEYDRGYANSELIMVGLLESNAVGALV